MNPMQVAELAMSTGLRVGTVDDLLRRGWTFVEKLGEPRQWIGPEAKLENIRVAP